MHTPTLPLFIGFVHSSFLLFFLIPPPTHPFFKFFLLHISFPTYPLIHFSIFFYYLSLSPPTHPSILHFFFCYTISFPTYPPTHPSILQFSFATYLIPHPPGHKICTSSFATYLIPHPPTHFALFLLLCISSQLVYSTTTASFGDDPVVAYIRTRIHRDLQLEILLFNAYCARGILKEREGEWGLQTASGFTCGGLLYHALWWLLLLC